MAAADARGASPASTGFDIIIAAHSGYIISELEIVTLLIIALTPSPRGCYSHACCQLCSAAMAGNPFRRPQPSLAGGENEELHDDGLAGNGTFSSLQRSAL